MNLDLHGRARFREARSTSLDAKFGSTKRTKLIRRRRFALLFILQNPGTKDLTTLIISC